LRFKSRFSAKTGHTRDMPWNDNSDNSGGGDGPKTPKSPWGSAGGNNGGNAGGDRPSNPWSQPPRRPSNGGPGNSGGGSGDGNLDDLAKRVEDKLKVVLGGKGGGPRGPYNGGGGGGSEPVKLDARMLTIAGGVLLLGWLATGVYTVDAGKEAVVTRFGEHVRTNVQGLGLRMPSPLESHTIVDTQNVNDLTVGSAGDGADETSGLMLTGDENIVNVGFRVFWRVSDSHAFLFNLAHGDAANDRGNITADPQVAEQTIAAVAESAMREVVGKSARETVLTTGRADIESQARQLIQRTLDRYGAGIQITQVNLTRAEPPPAVIPAFREVAAANQEAETKINQARAYRNRVVPEAQGEAARFNQLYQEYRLAPEVTRQRLYLETMERVYERANKVILDSGTGSSAPVMVLPPELLRGAAQGQGAAPARTAQTPADQGQPTQGGAQ
jgi:modulator of FtsH protease HflK